MNAESLEESREKGERDRRIIIKGEEEIESGREKDTF